MRIPPKIAVVVPVKNSRAYLPDCLDSIRRALSRYDNGELIVMDNGSSDGSYEILQGDYRGCARIVQVRDVTVGALRNAGAALADCDVLVFLDSDCVIAEDYFDRVRDAIEGKRVDATGSKVALPDDPTWVERTWYLMHATEREGPRKYINSGNLVVRKSAFDSVGGFNERLLTGEDSDLGRRLNQRGYKVYADPAVRAVHLANDKTVAVFFRKHMWRGHGMFLSQRTARLNKPTLMTFAHIVMLLAGLTLIIAARMPLAARLGLALACALIAPVMAVLYRMAEARTRVPLAQAVLLYEIYFLARIASLGWIVRSRLTRPRAKARPQVAPVASGTREGHSADAA